MLGVPCLLRSWQEGYLWWGCFHPQHTPSCFWLPWTLQPLSWGMVLPSGGTQHGSALQKDKENLAQALSDCVIYCKSVSFRGFQEARSHSRPSEISSFAEAKARKLIRDAGETEGTVAPGDWARVERAGGFLRCRARASRHRGSLPVQGKGGSSRAVPWVLDLVGESGLLV